MAILAIFDLRVFILIKVNDVAFCTKGASRFLRGRRDVSAGVITNVQGMRQGSIEEFKG